MRMMFGLVCPIHGLSKGNTGLVCSLVIVSYKIVFSLKNINTHFLYLIYFPYLRLLLLGR